MTAKVERLVNLTVALLEARTPMTFADIRRRTRYYVQDDQESARRMFERDKDDLRRLGVPVETRSVGFLDSDLGYIVDRGEYELPDVDLTPDEVAALALALKLTGDQTARLGLAKLAARAPDPSDLDPTLRPTVEVGGDPLDDLADPLVARQTVRFSYRRADGTEEVRVVDPFAILQRRGSWYLVGHDHERDDVRAFRVDRATSGFTPVGDPGAFERPSDLDVSAHIAGPIAERLDVEVVVSPDARWEVALRGGRQTGEERDGWTVHTLPGADRWKTVTWLLGLGDDVIVRSPAELRDEVVERLGAVAGTREVRA